MTIQARPYADLDAMAVFRQLDPMDQVEAELARGAPVTALSLFADWRAMEPHRPLSFVALTSPARGAHPFAVFGLINTGQAGIAAAALLARNHVKFRRPIAELAAAIRRDLPAYARDAGIHRIEARSWFDHPTASALLSALGFDHECDMPGFGRTGTVVFRQFAWVARPSDAAVPACVPTPNEGTS